jgi:hypothetical protein
MDMCDNEVHRTVSESRRIKQIGLEKIIIYNLYSAFNNLWRLNQGGWKRGEVPKNGENKKFIKNLGYKTSRKETVYKAEA